MQIETEESKPDITAVVETLIGDGCEPDTILQDVLSTTIRVCRERLVSLALEKMSNTDTITREANRWVDQGAAWDKAVRYDGADYEDYQYELGEHDSRISDLQGEQQQLEAEAALHAGAMHQALRLVAHLATFEKLIVADKREVIDSIVKNCTTHSVPDEQIDYSRFERNLRFLVAGGNFDLAQIPDPLDEIGF